MGAVDRLALHRGIPPGVEQEDVVRRRQVQAEAAGLQADQEHLAVRVVLEPLHPRLPVPRAAVEVGVGDFLLVQPLLDDRQHARELGEHQGLVSLVEDLAQLRQEHVELGAGFARPLGLVDQTGMAGRLPQTQQRLEDLDLRLLDPVGAMRPSSEFR